MADLKDLPRPPSLPAPEALKALWSRYETSRNPKARNVLVEAYLGAPFFVTCVRVMCTKVPWSLEASDLWSDAAVGLMRAVERFDPARKTAFTTYAYQRVQGAMLDGLRRRDHVRRWYRAKTVSWDDAIEDLTGTLGRPPYDDEIAGYLGVGLSDVPQVGATVLARRLCDPSVPMDESPGSDLPAGASLEASEDVAATLRGLTRREKLLLLCRFQREWTMKQCGAFLGISESRVSQLTRRTLETVDELRGLPTCRQRNCEDSRGGITRTLRRRKASGNGRKPRSDPRKARTAASTRTATSSVV